MTDKAPYGSFDDPYCYEGTGILKNLAGLRDAEALELFELEMTAERGSQPGPHGDFDPAHYRALHHHLFQDVYAWAGRFRTVRIAKDGAMFCFPEHIAEQLEILFTSLRESPFLGGASAREFIASSAQFLAELNAIHPFREGNGRTQLTFLFLLGERAGHPLDMARIRPKPMLAAMIASYGGKLALLEDEIGLLLV